MEKPALVPMSSCERLELQTDLERLCQKYSYAGILCFVNRDMHAHFVIDAGRALSPEELCAALPFLTIKESKQ